MTTVSFASFPDGESLDVEFVRPDGSLVTRLLFVDSGFTGQSAFVLSADDADLSHAVVPSAQVSGALQGTSVRALVICRIRAISFQRALIALLTDVTTLSLPPGVDGMVGLTFLRQFTRWGAERDATGTWRFFLSDGDD
jgi:hypothetical protein